MDAAITIADESRSRVALADETVRLLRSLWQVHGPLMFHQSGGCCDGSSPMCFPVGDFHTTEHDVLLGRFDLAGPDDESMPLEFWMSTEQFVYWSHTHLTVDVVAGRGSGFSVEAPEGVRFIIRSRLMETATPFA